MKPQNFLAVLFALLAGLAVVLHAAKEVPIAFAITAAFCFDATHLLDLARAKFGGKAE